MGWSNKIAHKLSSNYWSIQKQETFGVIVFDPPIKQLSFFDAQLPVDIRRNEMRIVVGEFLKHFAQLNLDTESDSPSEDEVFQALVDLFTEGEANISISGDKIDSMYKFVDEQ